MGVREGSTSVIAASVCAAVLVYLPFDLHVFGSVHVEVLHEIHQDYEALTINGLDVNLVRIAGEVWRDDRDAMLRVGFRLVAEGCKIDVDSLVLHHLGRSGAAVCVWTVVMGGKKESARSKCVVVDKLEGSLRCERM
jgi:hypothetical protein